MRCRLLLLSALLLLHAPISAAAFPMLAGSEVTIKVELRVSDGVFTKSDVVNLTLPANGSLSGTRTSSPLGQIIEVSAFSASSSGSAGGVADFGSGFTVPISVDLQTWDVAWSGGVPVGFGGPQERIDQVSVTYDLDLDVNVGATPLSMSRSGSAQQNATLQAFLAAHASGTDRLVAFWSTSTGGFQDLGTHGGVDYSASVVLRVKAPSSFYPPGIAYNVPEPGSLTFLGLLLAGPLLRRRGLIG